MAGPKSQTPKDNSRVEESWYKQEDSRCFGSFALLPQPGTSGSAATPAPFCSPATVTYRPQPKIDIHVHLKAQPAFFKGKFLEEYQPGESWGCREK